MKNETITNSFPLAPAGVEQSFGTLVSLHPLAEVIVNANGQAEALNSEWRLYSVTPTGAALIWAGDLDRTDRAQRLTPVGGIPAGSNFELRGVSRKGPTAGVVTASLVGYDPSCCDDAPAPPPPPPT